MTIKKYDRIAELLDSAGARFISVYFVKKDGTNRHITFNMKAAKNHVVGQAASESALKAVVTRRINNPNLVNVWDHSKQGFRSINMDTVYRIVVDGQTYDFG